jgi:hypothetical protein
MKKSRKSQKTLFRKQHQKTRLSGILKVSINYLKIHNLLLNIGPKHVGQVIAPVRDPQWLEMQQSSHT